jgi:hypothetical protein
MTNEQDSSHDAEATRFTQEEAQRRLSEVRMRYEISLAAPQVRRSADKSTSPKESAKQQPQPTLSVPGRPVVPVDRLRPDAAQRRAVIGSSAKFPSENYSFHYVIRIAECASILHCEVKADNREAARERVERIPNLMEWREVSSEELAALSK